MSILDELRKKADEKKASELQEEMTHERLEETYKQQLLPKMQAIFDCLNETINHLNFLDEPVVVKNYCPRYPQFFDLQQGNYKMNTDGRMGFADYNRLMEINLNFYLEAKGDFTYNVDSSTAIRKEIDFLQSKKVYFDWKYLDPVNGIPSANIIVHRKIPVSFRVAVDYKQSQLQIIIKNHENLETFSKSYPPAELDDNFIDSLLSYFLRRDRRLVGGLELTDEHKTAIKSAIQNSFASYQQGNEPSPIEPPVKAETEATPEEKIEDKKSSPLKNIFSKFQRKN